MEIVKKLSVLGRRGGEDGELPHNPQRKQIKCRAINRIVAVLYRKTFISVSLVFFLVPHKHRPSLFLQI